jgi:hypothetical protein
VLASVNAVALVWVFGSVVLHGVGALAAARAYRRSQTRLAR